MLSLMPSPQMPSLIMSRELHPFMDDNPFASDYSVPTAETSAKFIRWMISQVCSFVGFVPCGEC